VLRRKRSAGLVEIERGGDLSEGALMFGRHGGGEGGGGGGPRGVEGEGSGDAEALPSQRRGM